MSTVTKLKGLFNNPNLPVLTEEGLLPFYLGKYVQALKAVNFFLSDAQKEAIATFTEKLTEIGAADYVKAFYPFIGSRSNTAAAGVPLIAGDVVEFPSYFSHFAYDQDDNIIGLTRRIVGRGLTLGAFAGISCGVYGASYNKNAHQTPPVFDTFFHSSYGGYRIQSSAALPDERFIIAYRNAETDTVTTASFLSTGLTEAGNVYSIHGLSRTGLFNRAHKINDNPVSYDTGMSTDYIYGASTDDLSTPLVAGADDYVAVKNVTSLFAFNAIIPKSMLPEIINTWKELMQALGKEE